MDNGKIEQLTLANEVLESVNKELLEESLIHREQIAKYEALNVAKSLEEAYREGYQDRQDYGFYDIDVDWSNSFTKMSIVSPTMTQEKTG